MSVAEFSVCQFFDDGYHEYVRRYVSVEEAFAAFRHYTTSVAAQAGMTTRVIITDGGDNCCFEWQCGKGVTYPPRGDDGRFVAGEDEP